MRRWSSLNHPNDQMAYGAHNWNPERFFSSTNDLGHARNLTNLNHYAQSNNAYWNKTNQHRRKFKWIDRTKCVEHSMGNLQYVLKWPFWFSSNMSNGENCDTNLYLYGIHPLEQLPSLHTETRFIMLNANSVCMLFFSRIRLINGHNNAHTITSHCIQFCALILSLLFFVSSGYCFDFPFRFLLNLFESYRLFCHHHQRRCFLVCYLHIVIHISKCTGSYEPNPRRRDWESWFYCE